MSELVNCLNFLDPLAYIVCLNVNYVCGFGKVRSAHYSSKITEHESLSFF